MIKTHKVAIYIRVSTTSQVEEGYSIKEQKDKLSSYCNIKDWSIYNIYTDGGFSGSNTKRPALEQLIKDAKKKLFDTVLVYKLDRLSRSQKDTLYLIEDIFLENKIDFVSLLENFDTSTPFGKAMVGILSVFAQLEREQIKERMQLGRIGRAKSGKPMMWSKVAYGYTYDKERGELIVNELEAMVVREIYDQYLRGMSISKLRDKINEKYPKKPAWHYRLIRSILGNPVYCGYNQYLNKVYPGDHEPIVSEKVYNKTQEELKIRQRTAAEKFNPRPFQAKYMLSGIAQCGYCKAPLKIIMGAVRKDGSRIIRYECYQRHPRTTKGVTVYNNNAKCHSGAYEKQDIEAYVLQEVSKLQNDVSYIDELFANPQAVSINRESYQKQIDSLTSKLKRLNDLYLDDRISLEELKERSLEFITTRNFLEAELENDPALKSEKHKESMRQTLATDDILGLDYEQQKVIVRALINKVQVTAEDIVIKWKI